MRALAVLLVMALAGCAGPSVWPCHIQQEGRCLEPGRYHEEGPWPESNPTPSWPW